LQLKIANIDDSAYRMRD